MRWHFHVYLLMNKNDGYLISPQSNSFLQSGLTEHNVYEGSILMESHTRAVLSSLAVTIDLPSGEKLADLR